MADERGIGAKLGRSAGWLVRSARKGGEARPKSSPRETAQRLQQQAGPAIDRAGKFAREHEDEIRKAAAISLQVVAGRTHSGAIRLAAAGISKELARRNEAAQTKNIEDKDQAPPADE